MEVNLKQSFFSEQFGRILLFLVLTRIYTHRHTLKLFLLFIFSYINIEKSQIGQVSGMLISKVLFYFFFFCVSDNKSNVKANRGGKEILARKE